MKHHKSNRKFGRTSEQRAALLRSLAEGLILNGKINTTEAKAKELRPYVEKLITRAGTDTLAARRIVASRVTNDSVLRKLFTELGPLYKERPGGYTRIIKTGRREGDASKMAVIELVN